MLDKSYVVSVKQTNTQLYLKRRISGCLTPWWAFVIDNAGVFDYNDAVKQADKQKKRFTNINKLVVAPPAGYVHITICEIDNNRKILSSQDVLLPERIM